MTAPAPGRSSGTLTIGFGMLSITCAVYAGIEDAKITRSMRCPDGAPVKFPTMNAVTGELIERADTHLVYTCADDTEVPLSDEEIAEALGQEKGKAELVGFYPLDQFSRYTATGLMQVRPKKVGKADPFAKPFYLLMRAMEEKGVFALVKWTLRGAPSYGVLTSHGNLVPVRWADEVREPLPMPVVEVTDAETSMATALVEVLSETDAPLLDNEAVAHVRAFAESKAAAMAEGKPAESAKSVDAPKAISDLTAALAESIAAAKAKKVDA